MRTLIVVMAALLAQVGPQSPAPGPAPAPAALFAVVFRTGPAWDAAKPPAAQPGFKDHSANIMRLKSEGRLLIGGRFSDMGLLVVRAATREEAQSLLDRDPTVASGVFRAEVHPWSTFAPGCLESAR
jgi:uncharacterized protein YciI